MLMVMGGGTLVTLPFLARPSQACIDARAAHRPDAEEVCHTSHGSGGGGHGGWWGGSTDRSTGTTTTGTPKTGTTTPASSASVERGGFGSTGFHFFSFGG